MMYSQPDLTLSIKNTPQITPGYCKTRTRFNCFQITSLKRSKKQIIKKNLIKSIKLSLNLLLLPLNALELLINYPNHYVHNTNPKEIRRKQKNYLQQRLIGKSFILLQNLPDYIVMLLYRLERLLPFHGLPPKQLPN